MTRTLRSTLVLSLVSTLGSSALAQEVGDRQGQGLSREQMWRAPTAEDWAKDTVIRWQRTWEDAIRVSEETGKAILVCVNMDGEIASEHYAGIRYKEPEVAALYEPYVTVIASVYRHNPQDHDAEGNRIECPRFGTVTCGEHIAIEPVLYEKYFDGERVAPRHVMIELDGAETYDVYYAFDTASVFETIRVGIEQRENQPEPQPTGDRPLLDLVGSGDSADQEAVEQAYRTGTREERVAILRRAIQAKDKASVDLLRLAIFGFDVELVKLGREGLAQTNAVGALDLINEALRVPMADAEKEALVSALDRLGETSVRAKTLAAVHRGLDQESDTVDVGGWSNAMTDADAPRRVARRELEKRLEATESSASEAADAAATLAFAESSLALAVDPQTAVASVNRPRADRNFGRYLLQDALGAALEAEELGASGWRLDATVSLASYYLGDVETAHARAEAAVGAMPTGVYNWNAMAVLALFAQGREQAIKDAVRAKEDWPREWLTDVNAAYSVLAKHPLGDEFQVAAHYDFLVWLGAFRQAHAALDEGIRRFPDSWDLHGRLRSRILATRGVEALESTYEAMLLEPNADPNLPWHAGYTSMVAAEFHRRANAEQEAWESYGRAIEHYERSILGRPEGQDACDHYIAMAHAGRARMALDQGRLQDSMKEILISFERRQASAASLDGLNVNAVATARQLVTRMREDGLDSQPVESALQAMPRELLELPAYERGGPRPGRGDGGGGRGARAGGASRNG